LSTSAGRRIIASMAEAAFDTTHRDRVVALADLFARLARPDLALPLLQRLSAAEPDAPGLESLINAVARLDAPVEPPPPLELSAAGVRPEEMIERCLRAGALAVGRDLMRGLVARPVEPPEAAENLGRRLLAVERVMRRLGRRVAERAPAARPSVKHAEAMVAQGRLFDGIEECRLVLEREAANTEARMWVRDLEVLLAPVPDVFMRVGSTFSAVTPGAAAPLTGELDADDAAAEGPDGAAARIETKTGRGAGAGAAAAPAGGGFDSDDPETAPGRVPRPRNTPTPAGGDVTASIRPRAFIGQPTVRLDVTGAARPPFAPEATMRDVPEEADGAGFDVLQEAPLVTAAPDAVRAAAPAAPVPAVLPDDEPFPDEDVDLEEERTDLGLVDPAAGEMLERGDLRGALLHLRRLHADAGPGAALPPHLAALERLCLPGPGAPSALVTDAETALVGGDLKEAFALYVRAAEERPDALDVVRRARDLRFVVVGGRQPPELAPRAEFSPEEFRRVLMKRGAASRRVQASAGLWGRVGAPPAPGTDDGGERGT
jgi:hypothetical protein